MGQETRSDNPATVVSCASRSVRKPDGVVTQIRFRLHVVSETFMLFFKSWSRALFRTSNAGRFVSLSAGPPLRMIDSRRVNGNIAGRRSSLALNRSNVSPSAFDRLRPPAQRHPVRSCTRRQVTRRNRTFPNKILRRRILIRSTHLGD